MILQQALQQADTQELVQAVCEYHRATDTNAANYDASRCSALVKAYSGFIQALLGLAPRRNGDYVLLPTGRAADTIIAELYRNDEVRTALSNWHLEKIYTRDDLSALSLPQLQTVYQRDKAHQPAVYGYTVMPWAEVLAVDVAWPEGFSPTERLMFLASVLYEMSFWGFTVEEHRKGIDDLEIAVKEARTGQTYPIEELDPEWNLTPSPAKTDDEKRADLIGNILAVQHTYQRFRRIYGKRGDLMIYVTGDIHGEAERLGPEALKQRGIDMQPDDYIIVCGDFGIPWVGEKDEDDHRQLEWLAQLPYTVLFVDGNHENFEQLSRYPVKAWAGGRVHELRPNLYHLLRGEVFTIEGKTFFAFGGAKSTDKSQRWPGVSWWPQETASEANFDNAAKNLMAHDFTVDYVITHTAPARFIDDKKGTWTWRIVGCKTSKLLSGLEELMTYKKWYFGHFHVDYVRDDSVAAWMYKDVVPVGR